MSLFYIFSSSFEKLVVVDVGTGSESGLGSLGSSAVVVSQGTSSFASSFSQPVVTDGQVDSVESRSVSFVAGPPTSPTEISDSCEYFCDFASVDVFHNFYFYFSSNPG